MASIAPLLSILLMAVLGIAKSPLVSTVARLGQEQKDDWPRIEHDHTVQACTVLTINGQAIETAGAIQAIFDDFEIQDDVWSTEFSQYAIIQIVGNDRAVLAKTHESLRLRGVKVVHSAILPSDSAPLPQGPYFLHHGHLHQAYRLYPDHAGAFIVSTVPDGNDGFRSLDAAAYGEQYPDALTVAVPSRLYYTKTDEKPFSGIRIAVKDIIDLKGLKTGASSRAFTALYPVKKETAETVQHLLNLGFVIVGKSKSTQFADSEWPTCDYVDYHGPFNPRGDGYLTPSGSSSGSASAVATYPWLDFALGTDTLGSIRSPAAAQGIFSMRPTTGATSSNGLVPYSPKWDTIGGFSRTAAEYVTLAQALYGSNETYHKTFKNPTRLIYLTDYWPVKDETSQKLFDAFINKVEDFLGVTRTSFSLADLWNESRPADIDESIDQYLNHAFEWSANRDQWLGLLKPFLQDYTAKMGKPPVLNPQRLESYRKWFYEKVMPPSEDGYSSSIMILPWTTGEPAYRDTYKSGPQKFTGEGFFFYNVGPYAQSPELIIPGESESHFESLLSGDLLVQVGTTPYVSKFTGSVEQLPAAAGFIAAKGSDIMLADFVNKLFDYIGHDVKPTTSIIGQSSDEL
uniref:Amidase domain-containing protein n=1 Tax=Bionectria ochroleuca TaxID=29856 RepID=A0A0B7JQF9_BIOOC